MPYTRVKLDPSAVPTVFDNPSETENVSITLDVSTQEYISLEHSYCSPNKFPINEANDTPKTMETSSPINVKKHPPMDQSSVQKIPDKDSLTEHLLPATQNSRMDCPIEPVNLGQGILFTDSPSNCQFLRDLDGPKIVRFFMAQSYKQDFQKKTCRLG